MFIEPMQAMRILREHAYSMDLKKVHELALLATDDIGYANDLWERIAQEKLTKVRLET